MFFNWRLIFYPVPPGQLPLADIARLGQHPLADIAPPSRGSPPPPPHPPPHKQQQKRDFFATFGFQITGRSR